MFNSIKYFFIKNKVNIPIHKLYKELEGDVLFDFQELGIKKSKSASVHHRHNYYELLFFVKGGGTHEIDFESIPIKDSTVHFVSPGQVHLLNRDNQSLGFVILFSADLYHTLNASADTLYDFPFFNNSSNLSINIPEEKKLVLLDIFKQIKRESLSSHTDKYELLYFYLQILLLELKRLYTQQIIVPNKKQGTELIHKFKKAVEQYFVTERAVSFYAKIVHVSPTHLSDVVHDYLGVSPSNFIHNRIILEAKRILLHADKSVSEIAFALNFDDPSYFTRFFKKRVGLSPIDFRNSIRKKYQ